MENPYDHIMVVVGHTNLFKRKITQDEMIEIISEYPTSQWLDLFAKIEGFLIIKPVDSLSPQIFLAQRLFPESTLRRIKAMENSDGNIACFSLGQLNFLRKLAIVYGKNSIETEVPIPLVSISKIMLAAQDFHNEYDEYVHVKNSFESFCQFVIRSGYLNRGFLDISNLFVRAYQMYILQLEGMFFQNGTTFEDFFNETVGISIEQAMALSFALAVPFLQSWEQLYKQSTIIDPATYFKNIKTESEIVEAVLDSLTIDLDEARAIILQELTSDNLGHIPLGYNLDVFRKTPLIKLESGKLVCANLNCFFEKTTQNIIWLPKSQIVDLERKESDILVNDLTNYRGELFEKYVKYLCKAMDEKNKNLFFRYLSAESATDNEEVGDSVLIQGNNVVIIEAKSRQFNESFKYTGSWEEDKQFIEELVKKAAKQIEKAGKKLKQGKVGEFPLQPEDVKKIYPVILTYEEIPMHGKMQRFIRERVKEFGY